MLVIDTKWKRFGLNLEDAKHGVALADVFRILAYGRFYGCGNYCCFSPHYAGLGEGTFAKAYAFMGCARQCPRSFG